MLTTTLPENPADVVSAADKNRRWRHGTLQRAAALYGDATLGTGESIISHAQGMLASVETLDLDAETQTAAVFFAAADFPPYDLTWLGDEFGEPVVALVASLSRLKQLRPLIAAEASADKRNRDVTSQAEVLRKMLLAMSTDIRVVLLRLVSRAQSLRWFAAQGTQGDVPALLEERQAMARETLAVYAPLANRLGMWQVKWELEDLSFRFLEPDTYKKIARLIDEKRGERENFIGEVTAQLQLELANIPDLAGKVEVYGRPKHIYSIWNKMRAKHLEFSEVYDVRAIRVVVPEVRDCYSVLGVVHHLWQPIHGEFDDYISHPKGNDYRSLHTAVMVGDNRPLEVQIRTVEMHRHAELGVAAHWRYKEAGHSAKASGEYEDKIAWLRQLLSWRDDVADSADWVAQFKRAALDDTIYVMTPQGRVIDLPAGSTPIDFAYRVHTDLGHRCRGARVDGHMVPLNKALASGQRIDIISVKTGGPSRDWLNATQGYLATHRAKQKVRQWFAAQETAEQLTQGRAIVTRELQRLGESHASLEKLATRLGLKDLDALFIGAARGDVGPRAISIALRGEPETALPATDLHTTRSKAGDKGSQILVVGVDKLMTQMGRCCKPIPPDAIAGFVTRGRGVSIHRLECKSFRHLAERHPERLISAEWGGQAAISSVYAVDLQIDASDRVGLLRDISEVFTREHIGITAMNTSTRNSAVRMNLTAELSDSSAVRKLMHALGDVTGVVAVRRV
jgi:GTP pyrophosphokinase